MMRRIVIIMMIWGFMPLAAFGGTNQGCRRLYDKCVNENKLEKAECGRMAALCENNWED